MHILIFIKFYFITQNEFIYNILQIKNSSFYIYKSHSQCYSKTAKRTLIYFTLLYFI